MVNLIASLSIRRPKGWKKYIPSARPIPGLLSTVAVVENDSTDLAFSSKLLFSIMFTIDVGDILRQCRYERKASSLSTLNMIRI